MVGRESRRRRNSSAAPPLDLCYGALMSIPAFVDTVSDEMRARIGAELDRIEREHDVRILFAVESGSRAWGFPSPDSDYDVRFVYAHPLDWYLSVRPGRDVIELPIDDLLDINGWDIRKALGLLMKPNPVALEWLSSPIRYRWNDADCARLIAFAGETAHASACRHHYFNLGSEQWRRAAADPGTINYKKYFYALRPALALRWLRLKPTAPSMNLQALVAEAGLDDATTAAIGDLIALKAKTRETGDGPRLPLIDALIEGEFDKARDGPKSNARADLLPEADALFREIVKDHPASGAL